MIYDVVHRTTYRYAEPVDLSYHVMRLTPRALTHQRVLRSAVIATPAPVRVHDTTDYFGNVATYMSLEEPHAELVVDARCAVDVQFPVPPDPLSTPPWEQVRDSLDGGGLPAETLAVEFVRESPLVAVDDTVREFAAPSFPAGRPVLACFLDLNRRIKAEFAFDPRATGVATAVREVMQMRRGVCQDFAHVMIACIRAMGLAARYVSGYIRTHAPAGQPRRVGADASHAWVGVFVPGTSWIDVDPTNDLVVCDEHVVLGWGRDYGDVAPIRGVILGGGTHRLDVSVDLRPLDVSYASEQDG
ncbi:MAG: transglutaminase family protein [Rhodospirillales bacterium]|nr:transglutaminase family protein [Rhodospirillales bacterium]